MAKVLISGGSGMIGKALSKLLINPLNVTDKTIETIQLFYDM